ncbi:MAG: hypothetical protein KF852_08375 [Saprospiraceae bacterium]|nr:hypothetical protein [Saprospiraceae bacterium]
MAKYLNKYRVESARAAWWDYGSPGAYFITICTAERKHYFGEIRNGVMHLSHVGVIADILWYEIPSHAKNVELGVFVVMPNHIHGILILNGGGGHDVETGHALSLLHAPPAPPEETGHALSLPGPPGRPGPPGPAAQRFQNPGKNTVSSIMGSYKSAVTKHAGRLGFEFAWQVRFHDHIIRNDAEYQRINNYIESNPENWDKDRFSK